MSGFEVAGLVLGVLPLAVQALKTYREIMADVKGVPSDLANLIEDLETEMLRLRTSCELLLEQIVPFVDIADYLDDPMSPKWEKSAVNNKLRIRLSDSYPKFEEKVRDIRAVGLELEKKLRLREKMLEGIETLPFAARKEAILRIWKARVGFTLKKKDYNDIISRLKSANTFLHGLVKDSRVLGASRKRRSHNQIIGVLRNLAKSLFNALRGAATSCYCPQPHKACLELVVRDLAFIRNLNTEDQLAKEIPFHVVLASMVPDKTPTEPEKSPQSKIRWTSFRVQCGDFDSLSLQPTLSTNSTAPITCSGTSFLAPGEESEKNSTTISPSPSVPKWKLRSLFKGSSPKPRKTVAFESASATQTLVQVSTTTASLRLSSPQSHRASIPDSLLDLCQISLGKGKKPASDNNLCHGWIMDIAKNRRFGLYPPSWDDDTSTQQAPPRTDAFEFRTSFTLRQILDRDVRESTNGLPNLDFRTKLRIAQAISAGILQLHGTPWMNTVLTLDDIVLLIGQDSTFELQPFSKPVVADSVADLRSSRGDMELTTYNKSNPCVPVHSGSRPFHPTVFSLGLLLLQLVLERIDGTLDLATLSLCPPSISVLDVSTARKLAELYESDLQNEVAEKAADKCEEVIKWCLRT
ncbi:hypothetical protein QBC32DRAFT_45482 [Pseudoneurospora amorphoporcata]|uniref:Protein kinase domain-containing protein n=1 Tax=Pseudoneurospora amorphoporcata TaxID=241081 RepID=A0AAN6NQ53_9PEZI|nr:hypothetical protein QBC32DRAFT_45482 [Pseudoneurospora amorphoporcata]